MIVLDASTVVELLLGGARAEVVLPWMESEEGRLHAPALLDVEVAQAIRRIVASGAMRPTRGGAAVELLQALPVTRHPHEPLLPRIWELRAHLTAYDASYVALAQVLDAPLLTFDGALARASRLGVRVELLSS